MRLRDTSLPRSYRYQDYLTKPGSFYSEKSSYKYSSGYSKPPSYGSYSSRALHRQEVRDYLSSLRTGSSPSSYTNGESEKGSSEYSYSTSYRRSSRIYSNDNTEVNGNKRYDDPLSELGSRYSTLGKGSRYRLSGGSNLDLGSGGRYSFSSSVVSSRGGSSRGSPESDVKTEPIYRPETKKSISLVEDSVPKKSYLEEVKRSSIVDDIKKAVVEEAKPTRKSICDSPETGRKNIIEDIPRRTRSRTRTSSTGSGNTAISHKTNGNGHAARGLVGLRNIGNTCFMNSVLQCLSNTRPLLDYILEKQFDTELNTSLSKTKGVLMKAFAALLQGLWNEDKENMALSTLTLKRAVEQVAPCFSGYAQQDAQEFLVYLLEGLHQDVNRVTIKPKSLPHDADGPASAVDAWKKYLRLDNSKLVDLFVGQLKSSLQCTDCGYTSVTWDPFWDLSLPLPSLGSGQRNTELTRCLDLFMKEEVLDGDEKPFCSRCNARKRCTKSFSIQKFPRILVLHLKRFPPRGNYSGKLNGLVDFPLHSLSLRNYSSDVNNPMYNLIGVVNHTGGALSGHYTATTKHPYSGEWHEYNDTRVSKANPKRIVTEQAYVLFYEASGR